MSKEQVGWICGMGVGLVFGVLVATVPGIWAWVALIGWLIVMLAYLRIEWYDRLDT